VAKPKITIAGEVRYSEHDGLQGSLTVTTGNPPQRKPVWLELLPNAYEWPGIPKVNPQTKDNKEYPKHLHAEPSYRKEAIQFLEAQRRNPQRLWWPKFRSGSSEGHFWAYKDKVLSFTSDLPENDTQRTALLIKHHVLRRERQFDKIQREVEALENLEKLDSVSREPISESVRLFVWQRDKGQCVKCGSHGRLEFDHIIPVARGGSNTERNIQLLCEPCNRSKGANV
jgi:hypothetical protein